MRGDASGDGEARAFGHFALVELGPRLVTLAVGRELVLERIDALAPERGEFGFALFDERIGLFHKSREGRWKHEPALAVEGLSGEFDHGWTQMNTDVEDFRRRVGRVDVNEVFPTDSERPPIKKTSVAALNLRGAMKQSVGARGAMRPTCCQPA